MERWCRVGEGQEAEFRKYTTVAQNKQLLEFG